MLLVRPLLTLFVLTGLKRKNRYRLFRSYFNETRQWRDFDPFFTQKEDMFKNSGAAIYRACLITSLTLACDDAHYLGEEIATMMQELEPEKERLRSDPDKLLVLFREMVHMCLWRAHISLRI